MKSGREVPAPPPNPPWNFFRHFIFVPKFDTVILFQNECYQICININSFDKGTLLCNIFI
ncbi:hypothetical protein FKM82_000503 [Ascaphus truei]